jgi:hypothetical protein
MSRLTSVLPGPGTPHHLPDRGQQMLQHSCSSLLAAQASLHARAASHHSQAKLSLGAEPASSTKRSSRQVDHAPTQHWHPSLSH